MCCVLLCDYEKTFDLLILDDITQSLRHSSERIPVDGGIVSDPLSIKINLPYFAYQSSSYSSLLGSYSYSSSVGIFSHMQ